MGGGTLFASGSEAPTVALSSARTVVGWGSGLIAFFHSGDTRIRASESMDGGLTWSEPFDLVMDGAEQFSACLGGGLVHLVYVTQGKGLKGLALSPENPRVPVSEPRVLYMNHEETGDPAYPCVDATPDGTPHVICGFRRPGGWSVLYRRLEAGGWEPWETVDSGEGAGSGYAGLAAAADGRIHAIYRIPVGGRFHLFHRIRDAGGWSGPMQLTFSTAQNGTPSMAADGASIVAVWARAEGNRSSIVFRRFAGNGWESEVRLADTRDLESNFPTLTCRGGFISVLWEQGQSLVARGSADGGSTWSPELPVLPDSGARYPKAGPMGLDPNGLATFAVSWSRSAQAPWAAVGGVDVATVVLNPVKASMEALVMGGPSGDWRNPPPSPSNIVEPIDAIKHEPVPERPKAGGTGILPDGVLTELRDALRAINSRIDSLERRMQETRAESDGLYRDVKAGMNALGQRMDSLVAKPVQSVQPVPIQTTQPSTSAPRFRESGVRGGSKAPEGPGMMERFLKGRK